MPQLGTLVSAQDTVFNNTKISVIKTGQDEDNNFLLTAVMQPLIEDFQIICVQCRRVHDRTRREGNYKRTLWGQVEARSRESISFSGAFKIYSNLWEGKNLVIPNHQ
jgi:hypothetical protein